MSGLNPFRHKKAASTAGAFTAAREPPSLPTSEPGSRPRGQEEQHQAWQGDGRPGTADEWLAGIDTAAARQKENCRQQQDGGRELFERAIAIDVMEVEGYSSRPVPNSKTVRIASPPAKQIPSPDEGSDDAEEELGPTMSEYTATRSIERQSSTYRASTPVVELTEDPFNAATGSSGSSDDDDDEDEDEDAIEHSRIRNQEGLGLGLGPVADVPSLRRVSYQGDLRSRDKEQERRTKRATMDVDAFKRLLLTGNPGTDGTDDNKGPSSRETVATEQDKHREQSQSQQQPEKRTQKLPPPPPKSRRGKAIPRSTESTTESTPARPAEAPVSPQAPHNTTSHTKSPASSIHGAPPPSPLPRRQAARSEPSLPANTQHKRPPTPPLARRHSQMKRSSASATTSRLSLPPNSTNPLNRPASLNSATNPKTPPPPPSRRAGSGNHTDHGSTASSIADTASIDTSIQHHHKEESEASPRHNSHLHPPSHSHNTPVSASSRPQPPPPRRTTGSSSSAHSTDINSTSTRRPPSISTEKDSHHLPPPPPPLRKSSRSSNIAEPDVSAPSNANDILADLSRLQQELDEFRGQYGDGEVARNRNK
ncbi:hypothetical protein McanCB56680_005127 [Microsporum canis]